jgi:type IV secretory pathway VirB3-like protein
MEQLDQSTVIRAGQRPALMLYVPINIFVAEAITIVFLFKLLSFWALIFTPVHLLFVIKTADDFHWTRALAAWWSHCAFVVNKGLHGKGVITFNASPIKAGTRDYADFR